MPNAISRKELIRKFKALGYSGPFSCAKHQSMIKGTRKIHIPGIFMQASSKKFFDRLV